MPPRNPRFGRNQDFHEETRGDQLQLGAFSSHGLIQSIIATKELEHFDAYLSDVANGKAENLWRYPLPSLLVRHALFAGEDKLGPPPAHCKNPLEVKQRLERHLLLTG